SSSHSLNIVYFIILEPSQRLSYSIVLGYVDSQIFARYDSNSKKIQPRVSWMEKLEKDIPQYWQALIDVVRTQDYLFREYLEYMRTAYDMDKVHVRIEMSVSPDDSSNHNPVPLSGFHMLQGIASVDLQGDGSNRTFMQMAYNGETIASSTMDVPITENCIEFLEKCLSYGKEMLLRTAVGGFSACQALEELRVNSGDAVFAETPMVTLSSRTEVEDGMEMHVCRVDGFYPREIDASWTRDGEVWLQDTLHGSVAPNADGTYHYWLSIQIDPEERDRYQCRVEHDGLQEPLDLALKVPGSNLGLIIGCVAIGLVMMCVIVGTSIFLRNHRQGRGELQRDISL
ncbi:hypothetical protein L345_17181, partial [Ophiophagus hannah]